MLPNDQKSVQVFASHKLNVFCFRAFWISELQMRDCGVIPVQLWSGILNIAIVLNKFLILLSFFKPVLFVKWWGYEDSGLLGRQKSWKNWALCSSECLAQRRHSYLVVVFLPLLASKTKNCITDSRVRISAKNQPYPYEQWSLFTETKDRWNKEMAGREDEVRK